MILRIWHNKNEFVASWIKLSAVLFKLTHHMTLPRFS